MDRAHPPPRLNKLLELLPESDAAAVFPTLDLVDLPQHIILSEAGKPIDYVYFLTEGIGSVFVTTPEGRHAEAGIFGYEGYIPTSAVADVAVSTFNVNVQIPGQAYRMPYSAFRRMMRESRNFEKIMIRAIESFAVQLAYTAVSNAAHEVSERRPSVTTCIHVLEGNGLIRSERGVVRVRDRAGLEEFARDAYGQPEREYKRLMSELAL